VDKALIVKGSILDIARGGDTALAMLDAKIVLICDRSSSMLEKDAFQRKARFEVEDGIVKRLQAKYPGQIVLLSFNDWATMCLDGNLPSPFGSTNMAAALERAKPLVGAGLRGVLISDGEPDSEQSVFVAATNFKGKLDVVYVGPEGAPGQMLLQRLAQIVNGSFDVNDLKKPELLEERLTRLLLKAG